MKKLDKTVFAKNLRNARELRGYTQAELSRKTGLRPACAISNFETGRRLPSLSNLVLLASTLGVTTDYLLGLRAIDALGFSDARQHLLRFFVRLRDRDQRLLLEFARTLEVSAKR